MKLKRPLLTLLSIVMSTMTYGQNAIAIYQHDGKVTTFAFSEKPVVTYAGNDLVLTTTNTTVQYPVHMLKKLVFDVAMDPTNIEEMEVKTETLFNFHGETITISGGEPGSIVYIYDLKGMVVGQYRLDTEGYATISVQNLGKSLYIVKTDHFSFKFKKS